MTVTWIKLAPGAYVCERGYVTRIGRGKYMAHAFGRIARYPYRTLAHAQQAVENRE